MTATNTILDKAKIYVTHIFSERVDNPYLYHNLEQTLTFVALVDELAQNYSSTELSKDELMLAAWFQNAGRIINYSDF